MKAVSIITSMSKGSLISFLGGSFVHRDRVTRAFMFATEGWVKSTEVQHLWASIYQSPGKFNLKAVTFHQGVINLPFTLETYLYNIAQSWIGLRLLTFILNPKHKFLSPFGDHWQNPSTYSSSRGTFFLDFFFFSVLEFTREVARFVWKRAGEESGNLSDDL